MIVVLKGGALSDGEAVAALAAIDIDITESSIRAPVSRYKDTFVRTYDGRTAKVGLLLKAYADG